MSQKIRHSIVKYAIIVGAVMAVFAIFNSTIGLYTDWLWFASLGKSRVIQTQVTTQVGLWSASGLLVTLMLFINWFLIPRRALAQLQLNLRGRKSQQLVLGTRMLTLILEGLAALATVLMASEVSSRWMTFLTFHHAIPFGVSDPIFGLDASFYVFQLPLYHFLVIWVAALILVTVIGSAVIYLLAGRIRNRGATAHLAVLGVLFLIALAAHYQLYRFTLLTSSQGAVFGIGYTDVHARLPLLHVLTGAAVLCAVALVLSIIIRRWKPRASVVLPLGAGAIWLLITLVGPFYATTVQAYTVQPNELALEQPYITHNIRLTRYAYGLEEANGEPLIKEVDYQVAGTLTAAQLEANADILDNVRLWDWKPLRTTYEQLQEIRTYYTFVEVDVDRYTLDGRLREVTLAVRELDIEQMREDARTWVNQHLIYTHGYGLCLSPVSESSEEGLPNFLVRDIPPRSTHPTLAIDRPEIYFGEKTANYVIVNTDEEEFDYPSGDKNAYTRYAGPDGVALNTFFRRLAFATRFESSPILFSSAIRPDSRILFHRSLQDRVNMLAPMLWYDDDPYPVILDGRVIWLYDAYTWSDRFPYSTPGPNVESVWGLNYIRNSVKIAIDAYSGETTFYVVDPSDPLVQAYQAIFPDLFTPGEMMDDALREHLRYPEQLFLIQADVYAAYHMQDPRVFYNEEDLWQTPTERRETETALVEPYYVVMRLPNTEAVEFMMIRPYVPAGKQNMVAWLYADSDGDDYGQLGVYKFSKEGLVYGPMQVEARLDQDPYISQQLTLWNQRGSSVIRGNLIVIPLDGTLLYIEPLYLQAEAGQLPELKRVLVAHGNRVAMAEDLMSGLLQVLGEASETATGETGDVAALARSAQAHYEAAQDCLQRSDWTCYGTEMEAMAADLEALVAATEE
ncbi:MAG: UPF0182 family protein [Anaerolineae bacterium]|nr:UPF0182 family protein [Anaerolineae bacterium]